MTVEAETGKIIGRVALPETFAGLAWSADGKRLFVGGGFDDRIYRFDHAGGLLSNKTTFAYPPKAGEANGLPAAWRSADGKTLWVANVNGHSVARLDTPTGEIRDLMPLAADSYPYGLVWDEPGRLYVSLWNGAGRGHRHRDNQGGRPLPTQEHPNEMLLAHGGKLLYVANANRNSVSVIDLDEGQADRDDRHGDRPERPAGCTPSRWPCRADESILLVANANTNNLAVVNVKEPGASTPLGFIPTGWYPDFGAARQRRQVDLRDQRQGPELKGQSRRAQPGGPGGDGRHSRVHRRPDPGNAVDHPNARRVAHGGLFADGLRMQPAGGRPDGRAEPGPAGHPIPAQVGEPSPIKHVVYIIKENRTYDQVFGDMPEGNGDRRSASSPRT